jgi:hypothetical protein
MYQIEFRPGWRWMRDFKKFNASMRDEEGRFRFNGPYCRIEDWIELSREIGADYHILEIKWHDGICWFKTSLTEWRTPVDYAGRFAEGSRRAGIPFMFYYSSVINHNPQFDRINPSSWTPSYPAMRDGTYRRYLEGQMKEIVDQYHPDGLWFDWYTMGLHPSENVVAEFLRQYSPETVLTFNFTNPFAEEIEEHPESLRERGFKRIVRMAAHGTLLIDRREVESSLPIARHLAPILRGLMYTLLESSRPPEGDVIELVHYTTSEAHILREAWKKANRYRRLSRPWELIGPAGRAWDVMVLREDPLDLVRMVAITLANGGKYVMGAASRMDGSIYPNHVRQLKMVGDWYKPRKHLFIKATSMNYEGEHVPGLKGPRGIKAVGSRLGRDYLIHLFNFGVKGPFTLSFDRAFWPVEKVYIEPEQELITMRSDNRVLVSIPVKDIDAVDTILRVQVRT